MALLQLLYHYTDFFPLLLIVISSSDVLFHSALVYKLIVNNPINRLSTRQFSDHRAITISRKYCCLPRSILALALRLYVISNLYDLRSHANLRLRYAYHYSCLSLCLSSSSSYPRSHVTRFSDHVHDLHILRSTLLLASYLY
jgi:hypothetical protein